MGKTYSGGVPGLWMTFFVNRVRHVLRRTRRKKGGHSTYQPFSPQPCDFVLDKALEPLEVAHAAVVKVVVCLVEKNALDVEPLDLVAVLAVPVGIHRNLGAHLVQRLAAVVDGDIANGAHVGEGVELGHLPDVVAAWERLGPGTGIGVDDDDKVEGRVGRDSVRVSPIRMDHSRAKSGNLRIVQRLPGGRCQRVDVQWHHDAGSHGGHGCGSCELHV